MSSSQFFCDQDNDIPPLRLRRQNQRPRQRGLDHVRQLVSVCLNRHIPTIDHALTHGPNPHRRRSCLFHARSFPRSAPCHFQFPAPPPPNPRRKLGGFGACGDLRRHALSHLGETEGGWTFSRCIDLMWSLDEARAATAGIALAVLDRVARELRDAGPTQKILTTFSRMGRPHGWMSMAMAKLRIKQRTLLAPWAPPVSPRKNAGKQRAASIKATARKSAPRPIGGARTACPRR